MCKLLKIKIEPIKKSPLHFHSRPGQNKFIIFKTAQMVLAISLPNILEKFMPYNELFNMCSYFKIQVVQIQILKASFMACISADRSMPETTSTNLGLEIIFVLQWSFWFCNSLCFQECLSVFQNFEYAYG